LTLTLVTNGLYQLTGLLVGYLTLN